LIFEIKREKTAQFNNIV